jgi:hypothetical protein
MRIPLASTVHRTYWAARSGEGDALGQFAYNEAAAKQLFDQLQEISGIRYTVSCQNNDRL